MWNPTYLEIAADLRRSELERLVSRPSPRPPAACRPCGLRRRLAVRLVALSWRLDREAAVIALNRST